MSNEIITKTLQHVKDDNGEFKPIFPITTVDAVMCDINKGITLEDKLCGGQVGTNTYSYTDVFHVANNTPNAGSLQIDLPFRTDSNASLNIDMDINVSGNRFLNYSDANVYNVDDRYENPDNVSLMRYNFAEMSVDGSYIFVNTTPITQTPAGDVTYRLYRTETQKLHSQHLRLDKIITPSRARFTKDSRYLIINGPDSSNNLWMEIYELLPTGASLYLSIESRISGGVLSYFDTIMLANGTNVIVGKNPTNGGPALVFYTFTTSALTMYADYETNLVLNINGEIYTSPDSSKLVALSSDSSYFIAMVNNGTTGFYVANPANLSLSTWNAGSDTAKSRWLRIKFTPDSGYILGSVSIDGYLIYKGCDLSSTYAEYSRTRMAAASAPGIWAGLAPLPNTDTYGEYINSGRDAFRCIIVSGVNEISNYNSDYIARFGTYGGVNAVGDVCRVSYSASGGNGSLAMSFGTTTDSSSTYINSPYQSIISENPESLLRDPTDIRNMYADVFIHPMNGYAYCIRTYTVDFPVTPYYVGLLAPHIQLTASPQHDVLPEPTKGTISDDGGLISTAKYDKFILYRKMDEYSGHYKRMITNVGVPSIVDSKPITKDHLIIVFNNIIYGYKYNYELGEYKYAPMGGNTNATFINPTGKAIFSNTIYDGDTVKMYVCTMRSTGNADSTPVVKIHQITINANNEMSIVDVYTRNQYAPQIMGAFSKDGKRLVTFSGTEFSLYTLNELANTYTAVTVTAPSLSLPTGESAAADKLIFDIDGAGQYIIMRNTASTYRCNIYRITWDTTTARITNITNGTTINSVNWSSQISAITAIKNTNNWLISTNATSSPIREYTIIDNKLYNVPEGLSISGWSTSVIKTTANGDYVIGSSHFVHGVTEDVAGTYHITAYFNNQGWTNLQTNSNSNTDNIRFGVDDNRSCILIGNSDGAWKYTDVRISRITVTGENAANTSYRIGYSYQYTTDDSDIIGIVRYVDNVPIINPLVRTRINSYVIRPDAWIANDNTHNRICKIYHDGITQTSTVNISIKDINSLNVVTVAGLYPIVNEFTGYIELYSAQKPLDNIIVDIDILN